MKRFLLKYNELVSYSTEIEADTEQQAIEMVRKQIENDADHGEDIFEIDSKIQSITFSKQISCLTLL